MGCGCNGGKPVNLRANAGPPKIDPLAPPPPPKTVRQENSRSDFLSLKLRLASVDKKR